MCGITVWTCSRKAALSNLSTVTKSRVKPFVVLLRMPGCWQPCNWSNPAPSRLLLFLHSYNSTLLTCKIFRYIGDINSQTIEISHQQLHCFSVSSFNVAVNIVKVAYLLAQLVEALRYIPEGRGFDSRWCNWNFH